MNFLNKLSIKVKISLILFVVLFGFASIGTIYVNSNAKQRAFIEKQTHSKKVYKLLTDIQIGFLQERRSEKDFLLRMNLKYSERHNKKADEILSIFSDLKSTVKNKDDLAIIQDMEGKFILYAEQFKLVVEQRKKIGLDPKLGLLGKLNKAVLEAETEILSYDNGDLLASLYLLMRHEKNFLLTFDPIYITKMQQTLGDIENIVFATVDDEDDQEYVNDMVQIYSIGFKNVSKSLLEEVKYKKKMSGLYAQVEPVLLEMSEKASLDLIKANKSLEMEQNRSFTKILIAIVLVISIASSVMAFIGYNISLQVSEMTKTMSILAKNETDILIPYLGDNNELGEMAKSVQVFKEGMIEKALIEEETKEMRIEVEKEKVEAMEILANNFDKQVGNSINSLSSAAIALQSTAEGMKNTADTTNQSSDTVAQSSNEASMNVNTIASAMEEMSASASEIVTQINAARSISRDTSNNAETASQTITNLNLLVENIGEVVGAIQDIAEQTNLLALNATIEAARAGDAGKGFAVVADEVKKLATETDGKTKEINSRINEIKDATNASVGAMDVIIKNISDIDGAVTAVSSAIEEQNETTNEITRSTSEASQGAMNVSQVIVNVQKGARDTGVSADNVLEASKEVSQLSDSLKRSIQDFLNSIR
ncbi:MAG: methyl-accepting chemotaxis protein [Alphaproteobacteria bacterium]